MPPKKKPESRSERISVRVTPTQMQALKDVADGMEGTVSDLVRETVDGLAGAAAVAGPAFASVIEGTPAERYAALEVLRVQAEQYKVMAEHLASNYAAIKAELQELERKQAAS